MTKNPDALPSHATPSDMRTSYVPDSTAAGGEAPQMYNRYNTAAPMSGAGYAGHQATNTTHYGGQNTTGTF